jgi:molybdate transport system ATP-binding protein
VRVHIAASDVSISLVPEPLTTIMNQFYVIVHDVREVSPGETVVRMAAPSADSPMLLALITQRSAARLGLAAGRHVYARVKSVALLD